MQLPNKSGSLIRITSGKLKGRSIKSPNSSLTHPMGSREKLALFNMVSDHLTGAKVLDAFAGSGALGIEALSRGASEVVFIEKNRQIAQIIQENLKNLNCLDRARVGIMDVKNFTTKGKFDLIIADPPYDNFNLTDFSNLASLLTDDGIFILSHPKEAPEITGLKLIKTRSYAAAHLSVYAKI